VTRNAKCSSGNCQPDYHRLEFTGVIMCPARCCTQPTKEAKTIGQNSRTSNEPTKSMKWGQIVELVTTKKGRDSSSNNKLRRINEFVTVNLTRIEWDWQYKQHVCTDKTIQTNGWKELQQMQWQWQWNKAIEKHQETSRWELVDESSTVLCASKSIVHGIPGSGILSQLLVT